MVVNLLVQLLCLSVCYDVTIFLTVGTVWENSCKKVATFLKLSGVVSDDSGIILLNLTLGSTLQWGTGRDLLCVATLF